jgi:hypothetical protein
MQQWFDWSCVFILAIFSIFLFLEGFQNLRTGKVTRFGVDAFFRQIDVWIQNRNARWGDAKRIKITGIIAIVLAFEAAIAAVILFVQNALPLSK